MTHFGAHALAAQGRFNEAVAVLQHELGALQSAHPYRDLPAEDPGAAPLHEQLATYLWHLARYPAAANALERARALREARGDDSADMANLLDREAALADRLGEPRAEPAFRRAIAATVAAHGPDSAAAAIVRRNFGACLRDRGQLVEAYRELVHAVEVLDRRLGRHHAESCAAHKALARYRLMAGQPQHALDLAEAALDASLIAHPDGHPFIAGALLVVGTAHARLLTHHRALECLQRAESIFVAAYGRQHPLVAMTLAELGDVAGVMGELDAATELHEEAVAILAAGYPEHPSLGRLLHRAAGWQLRRDQ